MSTETLATSASAHLAPSGQYLTLRLGGEEYAIDILQVKEIRSYEIPTKMANSPDYIKGGALRKICSDLGLSMAGQDAPQTAAELGKVLEKVTTDRLLERLETLLALMESARAVDQ